MEYACTVWSSHTSKKKNTQNLEAVQRMTQFVKKWLWTNYSDTAMLQDLYYPTPEEGWWAIRAKIVMLFKILQNLVCISADQYISLPSMIIQGDTSKDWYSTLFRTIFYIGECMTLWDKPNEPSREHSVYI